MFKAGHQPESVAVGPNGYGCAVPLPCFDLHHRLFNEFGFI
jgi:hypothetical protein